MSTTTTQVPPTEQDLIARVVSYLVAARATLQEVESLKGSFEIDIRATGHLHNGPMKVDCRVYVSRGYDRDSLNVSARYLSDAIAELVRRDAADTTLAPLMIGNDGFDVDTNA
jgi:hypothetical protein